MWLVSLLVIYYYIRNGLIFLPVDVEMCEIQSATIQTAAFSVARSGGGEVICLLSLSGAPHVECDHGDHGDSSSLMLLHTHSFWTVKYLNKWA